MMPNISAFRDGDDNIAIVLDRRFSVSVPKDYARAVAWLVGNALAIGQGYSHLGAETKDMPFAPLSNEIKLST